MIEHARVTLRDGETLSGEWPYGVGWEAGAITSDAPDEERAD